MRGICGQYDNRNFVEINVFNINEDVNSTLIHESMHLILGQVTKWGNIAYSLKKINVIDDSKQYFVDFIYDSTIKIQEASAVYFEVMYLLKKEGELAAKRKIDGLRRYNSTYYNYLKPLIPLIDEITKHPEKCVEKSNQITTIVFHIAINSLNTDIDTIPVENFKSRKSIQRFISNTNLSSGILPFQRFKQLIKVCLETIKEHAELDVEEILNKNIAFGEQIKFLTDIEYRLEESNKIKKYILGLFNDSDKRDKIEVYLNTVKVKEVDLGETPYYAVPNSFKEYKTNLIKSNLELKDTLENTGEMGIIFIYGYMIEAYEMIKPYIKIQDNVKRTLCGSLGNYMCLSIISFDFKKNWCFMADEYMSSNILNTYEHPIVVNYKAFDYKNMKINGLLPFEQDVFIYCDRSYPNAIDILNNMVEHIVYAIFIMYDNMQVLLLKIGVNLYFFLPIVVGVIYKILKDIEDSKLNIKILNSIFTKEQEEVTVDNSGEMMVKFPEEKMNKLDIIINNLFQL